MKYRFSFDLFGDDVIVEAPPDAPAQELGLLALAMKNKDYDGYALIRWKYECLPKYCR